MIYRPATRVPYSKVAPVLNKKKQAKKQAKIYRKSHQFKNKTSNLFFAEDERNRLVEQDEDLFDHLRWTVDAMESKVIPADDYVWYHERYLVIGKRIGAIGCRSCTGLGSICSWCSCLNYESDDYEY